MQLERHPWRGVAVVAFSVVALACASSEPTSDFELDVDSDEIRVAISKEVARGMLEGLIGSELECDGELDSHMEGVLRALDEGGPRARAGFRDGETTVEGRRRGNKLDLEIRSGGSGKIEATMPWAIGRCLLGQSASVDETVTSSIMVKVSNEEGRNFSFRMR